MAHCAGCGRFGSIAGRAWKALSTSWLTRRRISLLSSGRTARSALASVGAPPVGEDSASLEADGPGPSQSSRLASWPRLNIAEAGRNRCSLGAPNGNMLERAAAGNAVRGGPRAGALWRSIGEVVTVRLLWPARSQPKSRSRNHANDAGHGASQVLRRGMNLWPRKGKSLLDLGPRRHGSPPHQRVEAGGGNNAPRKKGISAFVTDEFN